MRDLPNNHDGFLNFRWLYQIHIGFGDADELKTSSFMVLGITMEHLPDFEWRTAS